MAPTSLRPAVSERLQSLRRKLPILIFAAVACYGLSNLDSSKRRFDEAKATPLFVDQVLKDHLKQKIESDKDGGAQAWQQVGDFIYVRQYSTEEDFINRVVARISRSAEAKTFVAQATFKGCVAKALAPPPPSSAANEASSPAGIASDESAADSDQCSENYIASEQKADKAAQDQIAAVYRYLKPLDISAIRAQIDNKPDRKTYLESLLHPILDERSGLYIIYQVFRVSLIVIIAFALIAVIVFLLSTMMLADGVKTFTEQATSFIAAGKDSVFPAAKTAVVSIAALGVGTAVAAGVAINNKADRALAQQEAPPYVQGGTTSGTRPPNGSGTRSLVAHYDLSDTRYDYSPELSWLYNDFSDHRVTETPTPLPPVVRVFPRVIVARSRPTRGEVGLDPQLVTTVGGYFNSLTTLNQDISAKLEALVPPPGKDDIKVSNHVQNDKDKALLIDFLDSKNLISGPLKILEDKIKSDGDLKTALAELQRRLDKPALAKERSTVDKLFRGSDQYFVSKGAAQQFADLIESNKVIMKELADAAPNSNNQALVKSYTDKIAQDSLIARAMELQYLQGGKPAKENTFLLQLESVLDNLFSDDKYKNLKKPETLQRLNYWRETILTYTRIR